MGNVDLEGQASAQAVTLIGIEDLKYLAARRDGEDYLASTCEYICSGGASCNASCGRCGNCSCACSCSD